MFRKGGVVWTIWNILVAALFITLGIVTCINSGDQDYQNVIILIAGILVIVDAGLRLFMLALSIMLNTAAETLRSQLGRAVAASSELAIGILLILVSQGQSAYLTVLFQYLAYFLGILLITLGSVAILFGIVFIIKKISNVASNIAAIILGALLVTGGALVLVYANQEALLQIFFVFFGILFILVGIGVLFGAILVARAAHQVAKANKAAVASEVPESETEVTDVKSDVIETPAEEPTPEAEQPVEEAAPEAEQTTEEPKEEEKPEGDNVPTDKPEGE